MEPLVLGDHIFQDHGCLPLHLSGIDATLLGGEADAYLEERARVVGEPVFENNTIFPTPIMEIVHGNLDTCYWTNKTVPAKLAAVGRRTVKAFGIKSRFVHLEFFQLDRDRTGLGKKGDYVGLEVNMRPPGGYTPDMMNFAHSTDVFQIWADMVAFGEARKPQGEQYFCAYAGRRDGKTYLHSHQEIMDRYGSVMCMAERVPDALADDLCNMAYMVRLKDKKDIDVFFNCKHTMKYDCWFD